MRFTSDRCASACSHASPRATVAMARTRSGGDVLQYVPERTRTQDLLHLTVLRVTRQHQLLTEGERSVLRLLAKGMSNRAIGRLLHLTEGTVKGYVSNVLAKLKLKDRTQAALFAVRLGMNGEQE
jgi:DNA-binding NarL/FixJ family response regulator